MSFILDTTLSFNPRINLSNHRLWDGFEANDQNIKQWEWCFVIISHPTTEDQDVGKHNGQREKRTSPIDFWFYYSFLYKRSSPKPWESALSSYPTHDSRSGRWETQWTKREKDFSHWFLIQGRTMHGFPKLLVCIFKLRNNIWGSTKQLYDESPFN